MSWRERRDQQNARDSSGDRYYRHRHHDGEASTSRPFRGMGNRGSRQGRGGRPPGLTGKDIGLYYRDRNMAKKAAQSVQTVSMDSRKEQEISQLLGIKQEQDDKYDHRQFCNDFKPSSSCTDTAMHIADRKFDPCLLSSIKKEPGSSLTADHGETLGTERLNLESHLVRTQQTESASTHCRAKESSNLSNNYVQSVEGRGLQSIDWWAEVPVDGISTDASCSDLGNKNKRHKSDEDGFTLVQTHPTNSRRVKQEPCSIIDEVIDISENETVAEKYSHVAESVFKSKFLENITGTLESKLAESIAKGCGIHRNPKLDEDLKKSLLRNQECNEHYKKMMDFRSKLPAYQKRQQIIDLINENQVVLISGETGCGKTTQVAQYILDDYISRGCGSLCRVECTQPRRISATSVAYRVADERREAIGASTIGYSIRLDSKLPNPQGSILFCTTGIVLQKMMSDPALSNVSHLILDEIHERNVTSDFIIAILKDVIPKRRDLKVILMSATLNAEQFSSYYNDCPILNIPGFTFPVTEHYLEHVLELTGYRFDPPQTNTGGPVWKKYLKGRSQGTRDNSFEDFVLPHIRELESTRQYSQQTLASLRSPNSETIDFQLIATLLHSICLGDQEGAILVFLPGWSDISNLHKELTNSVHFSSGRYLIIPLHSMMPTTVQRSVFDRPPRGVRKIVIATNIAETSITIDDVVHVIDCGKIKMTQFDLEKNIESLKPEWVSLANAKQRKGRAGRVCPGVCYHLYTRGREVTFADYPLPEMLRTKLHQVVLQLKFLQLGMTRPFLARVMDPPDERAITYSLKMLRNLNALDDDENLTPLGYHLAKLPMDPQPGKMILMAAIFSCVDPILSVAASLNFKDPFVLPLGKEENVQAKKLELSKGTKSDHLALVEAVMRWERAKALSWHRERDFCSEYFLNAGTLKLLDDMKEQLAEHLYSMNFLNSIDPKAPDANRNSGNVNLLRAIICAGLYPNVVQAYPKKRRILYRTPEDGRVTMHIKSVNEKVSRLESNYLVYYLKLKSFEISLHDTTMVYPLALLFFGEGVHVSIKDGRETIHVNEHIYFNCRESTANLVKLLRKKLDCILEHKISHPGTIAWDSPSEGHIVRKIIELIANEDQQL